MLKKIMTPPCLINQKSSDPPLSISNFFMTPLPFCRPEPSPLEINKIYFMILQIEFLKIY